MKLLFAFSVLLFIVCPHIYAQEFVINVPFTQPKKLVVNAGENQTVATGQSVILGNDAAVTGGTPGYTYAWRSPSGEEILTSLITVSSPGTYRLTVSDVNHCSASDSVKVTLLTETPDLTGASVLALFPNPSAGILHYTINFTGDNVKLEVISPAGEVLMEKSLGNLFHEFTGILDLTGFGKGVFYLRITGDGISSMKPCIIQ
jgi:hypothetical protein